MTLRKFGIRCQYALALPIAVTALAVLLSGCNRAPATTDNSGASLLISAEDTIILHASALTAGPSITGSVQPERRADLRAERDRLSLKKR